MYVMINDIKGEKTSDLSYPIYSKKEIAVVSMHISNSEILLHRSTEFFLKTGKKIVLNKGVSSIVLGVPAHFLVSFAD